MNEQLIPALLDGFIDDDYNTSGYSSSCSSSCSSSNSIYDDDQSDEDGDVCRICQNSGDVDNPLRYPCVCSGSMKFVHDVCLLKWVHHSNTDKCQICKYPLSFSSVYAENTPAKLSCNELVIGMSMKLYHVLLFTPRVTLVLYVWLKFIPYFTFLFWRFSFVTSFGEISRLYMSRFANGIFLTDYLHGFLVSASIPFIYHGVLLLTDDFKHLQEINSDIDDNVDDHHDDDGDRNGARVARRPPPQPYLNFNGSVANVMFGAGDQLIRLVGNVAVNVQAGFEQIYFGLEYMEDVDDVPYCEQFGLQGPLIYLLETAITVVFWNKIVIGILIFVPFHLGRVILYLRSWILSTVTNPVLSTVVPLTEQTLTLSNITLKNTSWMSDATTLAVGYTFIVSVAVIYFGTVEVIRYIKGEPLIMGRFYSTDSIAETVCYLFKRFLTAMKHLAKMMKVALLLVIELGIFPLMCGWLLDICTVSMFGKTIGQRVDFFSVSPLASSLIHWAVGIVYMLQISVSVSLQRGVLRNGVLYILRDPADPNYNLLRDLIDDPVHKHACRLLLSVAVYVSLIVTLVFLPVKPLIRMIPSIFPLDISVSDPFTEFPTNMLLFQIFIPFAIEQFKLRTTMKSLLHYWFATVGWALGLVNTTVYKYAWVGPLGVCLVFFCANRFNAWYTKLHNSIRDDRYFIGKRVHNIGEV